MPATEPEDPGEVDLTGPAPAFLPSDSAQNQWGRPRPRLTEEQTAVPRASPSPPAATDGRAAASVAGDLRLAESTLLTEGPGSTLVTPTPAAALEVPRLGDSAVGLRPLSGDAADPYPWLPPTDRVVIPSVGIDAKVVTVGVTPDGYVDTPAFAVGRFVASTQAGGIGNVVLSAHNDIEGGLFGRLPELRVDASVRLHRGPAVFVYQVRFRTKVWEEGAPTEVRHRNARFLRPTTNPVCTLITCVPRWVDTHRWIVRSALVDAELPEAPRGATLFFGSG